MATHFHEHHSRSLVKTITYRVLIIISNGIVVYAATHEWRLTLNVMGISSVVSTIIYFLHERAWNSIHWGKIPAKRK
jgi:uncharacterized membrane protein